MIDWGALAAWFLQAALAGGAALATFVFLLPTRYGEKLLGYHFERKLQALKDTQNRQIEELKEKLAHLGDRGKRSNEREFIGLSTVWEKFVDAFLSTSSCAIGFLSHPDLERMSSEELALFLDTTELSQAQRAGIISSSHKNKSYSDVMTLRSIAAARRDIYEARLLLRKHGIFIPADLRKLTQNALEMLSKAQVERYVSFEHGAFQLKGFKAIDTLLSDGEGAFDELMSAMRERMLRDRGG